MKEKTQWAVSFARSFMNKISEDKVTVYSAQASFFIIISAVPLVMLVLSLLQYMVPITQPELIEIVADFLPAPLDNYAVRIINELYQSSVSLISVTAISTLWAASRSVFALTSGLDEIYKSPRRKSRGYIKLRVGAIFYTLLLAALLIFCLVLLVFGNTIQELLESALPLVARFSSYVISFRNLLSIVLITFSFAVLYKILPNSEIKFRFQIPGAFIACLGWIIFSLAFSFYIDNLAQFSYTYGSLTTVVLMMLWLYFLMCIFLIGAEINVWLVMIFRRRDELRAEGTDISPQTILQGVSPDNLSTAEHT